MAISLDLALIQLRSPADPAAALAHAQPLVDEAAGNGARLILLPECANLMQANREAKAKVVATEVEDVFVQGVRDLARRWDVEILIGSAILKNETDDRSVNRSLLIDASGEISARYDKIHLFDADTPDGKIYRESASVKPGDKAVVAATPWGGLGLTICYDVRFPHLHRSLARQGASMIAQPAAFTVPTGVAHWEVLLRARAIECGCFVLAPAQGGLHEDGRTTYGHSMVISPWGEVLARLDHDRPAVLDCRIEFGEVARARAALPSLTHDREFEF